MHMQSPFQEPQQMMAIFYGIKSDPNKTAGVLAQILHKVKNPPLSILYTYHFLCEKSQTQYCYEIIRFVSQLSDLSQGVSMGSSLANTIGQSAFLTQLRHNLTHKQAITGNLIVIARQIILQELYDKYWKVLAEQYTKLYYLNWHKIMLYYRQIYQNQIVGKQSLQHVTQCWLINCSIYQFKEFFLSFVTKHIEDDKYAILNLLDCLEQNKISIAFRLLLNLLLQNCNQTKLKNLVIDIMKLIDIQKLDKRLILSACQKEIVEAMPEQMRVQLEAYWSNATRNNQYNSKIENSSNF